MKLGVLARGHQIINFNRMITKLLTRNLYSLGEPCVLGAVFDNAAAVFDLHADDGAEGRGGAQQPGKHLLHEFRRAVRGKHEG